MLRPTDIQAINFIQENYSFFASPLLNQQAYQRWIITSGLQSEAKKLSDTLKSGLTYLKSYSEGYAHTTAEYIDALIGKSIDVNDLQSLQYFNNVRLTRLFESNKKLAFAIYKVKHSPVIYQWSLDYQEVINKRKLLTKHANIIQTISNKIIFLRAQKNHFIASKETEKASVYNVDANHLTQALKGFMASPLTFDIENNKYLSPFIHQAKKEALIKALDHQLSIIREKSHSLFKRGFIHDSITATIFVNSISKEFKAFISAPATVDIKTLCMPHIHKAKKALSKHRGWDTVLTNLALAIIGLGIFYIAAAVINKAVTGNFLFFKHTNSENKVKALNKNLDKILDDYNNTFVI